MEEQAQNISLLIKACQEERPQAQRKLYELFYSYGMSICLRYAPNRGEAQEILNDGFFKVFSKINQFDERRPFKQWFRVILINAAIDHHRKYHKLEPFAELGEGMDKNSVSNTGLEKLQYDDVMECVQQLSPQYRLVFNLFAVDGLTHVEIAQMLDINVGTSKSNFSKARKKLMESLKTKGYLKSYKHG